MGKCKPYLFTDGEKVLSKVLWRVFFPLKDTISAENLREISK